MSQEDWHGMLNELLSDASDTMTAWEVEFIESIERQRDRPSYWHPSDKQLEVLSTIWHKVFGG